MSDMGCSCAKAQVTAHIATSENSERRKSWSGFPKTLECEKWGGCFITASPHSVLPPLLLRHFVFLLSLRASRFTFTRASAASPNLDLRDGAEEGSWKPEEGDRRIQP